MQKRKKQRRTGYVLVMTLLLVGLCGAILARIAQLGVGHALDASRKTSDLQQKWAVQSCKLQLLGRAEWLLESAAAATAQEELDWPYPSSMKAHFRLGDIDCDVVLADEESKPNLNVFYADRPEQLSLLAGAPFREMSSRPPRVRLAPNLAMPGSTNERAFDSWGQVYDLASTRGNIGSLRVAALQLTCWGKGRLNVTRATDLALEQVASLALNGSEVQSLLEARAGYSGDLNEMLKLVDVPGRKKSKLRRLITDRSSTFSIWLTTKSGQQSDHVFAVREAGRRDVPTTISFYWP